MSFRSNRGSFDLSVCLSRCLVAALCLAALPAACGSDDGKTRVPGDADAGAPTASGAGGEGGDALTHPGGAPGSMGGQTAAGAGGAGGAGGSVEVMTGGATNGGEPGSAGQGGGASDMPFDGDCGEVSLLINCGFELPEAAVGNYVLRSEGQDLSGWLVIGPAGNVGALHTAYVDGPLSWPAQQGTQSLDLTGTSNTAMGVSQSVVTSPGKEYELSFWLGNIVDSAGNYGTQSTVTVLVDGAEVLEPTNTDGADTKTLAWRQYTTKFTAKAAATTVAFVNADTATDLSNVIDNVVLLPR